MLDFAVFNEVSLPLPDDIKIESTFGYFFGVLKELKNHNLTTVRMDRDFKNYDILPNIAFQQFLGQVQDRDFELRLKSFAFNKVIVIDSPLIKDNVDEDLLMAGNYSYDGDEPFIGGLACSDIWSSIAVSFSSHEKWNKDYISIEKDTVDITIKHVSMLGHLNSHQAFFDDMEEEYKLGITQDYLWERKKDFFPIKIVFCKEIEKQIKTLDKIIFQQAISILRDIETNKKSITDYKYSGESQSVKNDDKLKKLRYFTINNEKVYFDNHIKSLPNANRIYFLEKEDKIYIGYIGKHLQI